MEVSLNTTHLPEIIKFKLQKDKLLVQLSETNKILAQSCKEFINDNKNQPIPKEFIYETTNESYHLKFDKSNFIGNDYEKYFDNDISGKIPIVKPA